MVICLERGADLHLAQLMPLPLTVSCSSKIQIGFTFLVRAYSGCPGKQAVKWLLLLLYGHFTTLDNQVTTRISTDSILSTCFGTHLQTIYLPLLNSFSMICK